MRSVECLLLYIGLLTVASQSYCKGDEQWGSWSACSVTCGEGQRKRTKPCTNSASACEEAEEETKNCFPQFCPSYLSWPRIHFSGKMAADVNTENNVRCDYENDEFSATKQTKRFYRMVEKATTYTYYDIHTGNWNSEGSNQIYFVDAFVTSFCNGPNNCSLNDSIVGVQIIETIRGTMSEMDPDWQKTEIWNLKVKLPGILEGDFAPASRYVVGLRVNEVPENVGYAMKDMTRFKSKLKNVIWYDDYYKNIFSNARELSFTFVYDIFNQEILSGRISGTIGLTSADEPRQTMANRILQLTAKSKEITVRSPPFFVHYPERTLTIDFGFSVKGTYDGTLFLNLEELDLVLLFTKRDYCEHFQRNRSCSTMRDGDSMTWRWITKGGALSKRIAGDNTWYTTYGGVMDFDLSHLDVKTMNLLKTTRVAIIDRDKNVFMEEFPHGINMGLVERSVFRLDKGDAGTFYGFVSSFGRPVKNAQVNLYIVEHALANTVCEEQTCNRTLAAPKEALKVPGDGHIELTNRSGLVRLDVKAVGDPGAPRGCGLDGQIYPLQLFVRYSKNGKVVTYTDFETTVEGVQKSADHVAHTIPIAVRVYTYVPEKECPTWSDVRRIFVLYYNLYPVMWKTGIIDLHSYEDITKRAKMLKVAMLDMDMTDPRYMPVTRDLSKGKRNLIRNWMKCGMKRSEPAKTEQIQDVCSDSYIDKGIKEVRYLIQKAMLLELSTIPPYVNAWLSLKTEYGRNKEIADILKSIFNEEMLHMTLDGNILNAIGGVVNMTDQVKLPIYPTILASGEMYEVLPDIEVGLAPFSIGLVEDVFSKVEQPSGARGQEVVYNLAQIWKILPSKSANEKVSANMGRVLNKMAVSNDTHLSNLTTITWMNSIGEGYNESQVKTNLEGWRKVANFANEKLDSVKDLTGQTVGEFYSIIALKLASLESCLQIRLLENMLRADNNDFGKMPTIFTGNISHQLNISHWYQKSETSVLAVVESLGGHTSVVNSARIRAEKNTSFIRPTVFEVTDLKTALEAIVEIAYQGEGGSECSPFVPETNVYASERGRDDGSELSHYFRFQEIVHGRKLVKITNPPFWVTCLNTSQSLCPSLVNSNEKYCYVGEKISFYEDGIWPTVFNPQEEHYMPGTKAHHLHDQFNILYTRLLFCLQTTFGGNPTHMRKCMTIMYDLTIVGKKLVRTPLRVVGNTSIIEFPKSGFTGAPTWLFSRERTYKAGMPVRIARKQHPETVETLVPPN